MTPPSPEGIARRVACAKVNLGLNVVERRPDGYHNLETVFYPVPPCDTLQVGPPIFPASPYYCDLTVSTAAAPPIEATADAVLAAHARFDTGDMQHNLVVRAYYLLRQEFGDRVPRVHAHLVKNIPTQAGMGGGSSDGAAMLVLLNDLFQLGLTRQQLEERAARLGADCPFFVSARPAYAEGIGERLQPVALDLGGWHLVVVRPDIPVPTRDAFAHITPHRPERHCRDIVAQPVSTWRNVLTNDFEQSVFALHPEIGRLKARLYDLGATYAAMSGSGSALFALFDHSVDVRSHFPGLFTHTALLPHLASPTPTQP